MGKNKSKANAKHAKMRMSAGDRALSISCYVIFTLCAILCVYPFYYIIINTISNNDLVTKGIIIFLPKDVHFNNYVSAFKIDGLFNAFRISVLRTVIGTSATVLTSAFLGFMFTQQEMWHRKIWYRLIVATMYFNAGIIPWFITMMKLGLTNNVWGYIFP